MDMEEFLREYFKALTKKFRDLVPPDQMKEFILIDKGNSPWQPDFKGKLADLLGLLRKV